MIYNKIDIKRQKIQNIILNFLNSFSSREGVTFKGDLFCRWNNLWLAIKCKVYILTRLIHPYRVNNNNHDADHN